MKTKREIAQIYFPKLTADSAVRKLSRTGYKSGNHTLSDRQISMIYDYLGEP